MQRDFEVIAGGQRIGYMQGVTEWLVSVWDDEQDLVFTINQATGHVTRTRVYEAMFDNPTCGGTPYTNVPSAFAGENCPTALEPPRREVRCVGGDLLGFDPCDAIYRTSGIVEELEIRAVRRTDGECDSSIIWNDRCVMQGVAVTEIPKTFELPITIQPAE